MIKQEYFFHFFWVLSRRRYAHNFANEKFINQYLSKMNMKFLNLCMVALMAISFSTVFSSCSNDDESQPNLAEAVAGTYNGYTKAVAQYFPNGQYASEQQITITANEDGTAHISYISSSFGTFTIENATVISTDNVNYTFTGSGKTIMGMEESTKKEYVCTITGTINSSKVPSFVFTVPAVMNGLTITFAPGDAPTSGE